jgi:hypothetical protein
MFVKGWFRVYLYCVCGLSEIPLIAYTYISDCSKLTEQEYDALNKLVENHVLITRVGDVFRKAVSTNWMLSVFSMFNTSLQKTYNFLNVLLSYMFKIMVF